MTPISEDELALQRLFEKWVKKKRWKTNDAARLFLGLDPDSNKSIAGLEELQQQIQAAIDNSDLKSVSELSDQEDELEPVAVFQWARKSGVNLPAALVALMEFIMKVAMASKSAEPTTLEAPLMDNTKDVEKLLGGCLAVVSNYPQECTGRSGKIKVELILKTLDKYSDRLFGDSFPALSSMAIRDIVNNWVQKLS